MIYDGDLSAPLRGTWEPEVSTQMYISFFSFLLIFSINENYMNVTSNKCKAYISNEAAVRTRVRRLSDAEQPPYRTTAPLTYADLLLQ